MLTRILDQNIQNLIGWLCHITFTIQIPSTKISRFGINPDFGHLVYRSSGTVWIQIPDIQIPDSYVWYSDQMSGPSLKTRPLFKLPLKNPFFCYSDHHSVRGPFNYRELFKHLNTETVWYSDPRCLSIATLDWEFSFGFFLPVSCPQVQPGSVPSGSRG